MSPNELNALHSQSFKNKEAITKATQVGCIACCQRFKPSKIVEYVDVNQTALCPYCDIDSVIPLDNIPSDEKQKTLDALHRHYF